MNKLIINLLLAACIFYSCGAGEVHKEAIQNSKTYDMPREKVWNTVLGVMAKKWFYINTHSDSLFKAQYEYRELTVDEMYKYTTTEGGDYVAAREGVYMELTGDSLRTTLTIDTDFEGLWKELDPIWGTYKTGYQKLYSKGLLEKEILDELDKELEIRKN